MRPARVAAGLLGAAVFATACQATGGDGLSIAMDELVVDPAEQFAPTEMPTVAGPGETTAPTDSPTVLDPTAGPTTGPTDAGEGSEGGDDGAPDGGAGRDWSALEMGRGVTEDTITIGLHSSSDLTAAFAALGANATAVDEGDVSRALVNWFNERGGIAGRRVEIVLHETNPVNGSFAQQAQAACATFTQDNEVFVVMSSAVGGDDSMLHCLAERNQPLIEGNLWLFDEPYYNNYRGILYQPARMMADRWVRTYVDGLEEIGYLQDGREGLGLLRFNAPVFERMANNVLKPRLQQLGYSLADEVVVQSPKGVGDFVGMANELNAAVLRMKANDVTHLMFLENNGIAAFFFFGQAESQGFNPRYAFNSLDIMGTMENNADPAQLENSVGISFYPPSDLNGDRDHLGNNPNLLLCEQIMRDAGLLTTGYYTQPRCDAFFFLAAALENAPALTKEGLLAGVEALGTSYRGSMAPHGHTRFGRGDYDGVNSWLPVAYRMGCECFVHTGDVRRLP